MLGRWRGNQVAAWQGGRCGITWGEQDTLGPPGRGSGWPSIWLAFQQRCALGCSTNNLGGRSNPFRPVLLGDHLYRTSSSQGWLCSHTVRERRRYFCLVLATVILGGRSSWPHIQILSRQIGPALHSRPFPGVLSGTSVHLHQISLLRLPTYLPPQSSIVGQTYKAQLRPHLLSGGKFQLCGLARLPDLSKLEFSHPVMWITIVWYLRRWMK